jgi:beta-mannanase
VQGTVLLRILHEFNGDWYPWCTVKNDKNPFLLAKAFRYIHNIFKENNVTNVKFIWCPNSMSIPSDPWNYIMDAYPGDEYVDIVGLDIYNGAGTAKSWRSFRKEGIENYFLLTQELPEKPLIVCETASRERRAGECGKCQDKEEWIKEMSEALKTDMSKIRLLSWFNEKETFKLNSSSGSKQAYLNYVMKDDYYRSGPFAIKKILEAH